MRDLAGVVQREEAQIGVLISPSSDLSEATGRRSDSAGCFETTLCWSRYPRLRQQAETTVIASASATTITETTDTNTHADHRHMRPESQPPSYRRRVSVEIESSAETALSVLPLTL